MGTTCEIARISPDGTVKQIHVGYDGYLEGVGLKLFKFYREQADVDALFSRGTHLTSLTDRLEENDWGSWTREHASTPLDSYIADQKRCDEQSDPDYAALDPEDEDDREDLDSRALGIFFHAHGKWCHPRDGRDLIAFIETGESPRVITRELLAAEGVDEDAFAEPASDPVGTQTGILRIVAEADQKDMFSFELHVGRHKWSLNLDDDVLTEEVWGWDGRTVKVRTGSMAVTSSIPGGSSTVAQVLSMRLDEETAR
jgi:hypothetical protein